VASASVAGERCTGYAKEFQNTFHGFDATHECFSFGRFPPGGDRQPQLLLAAILQWKDRSVSRLTHQPGGAF